MEGVVTLDSNADLAEVIAAFNALSRAHHYLLRAVNEQGKKTTNELERLRAEVEALREEVEGIEDPPPPYEPDRGTGEVADDSELYL